MGKSVSISFLLVFCCATTLAAGTRRALLVGINDYHSSQANRLAGGRAFCDLDGPLNDVNDMSAILAAKYGFAAQNIKILRNAEATKRNILDQIQERLIDPVQPGDICCFFYAGHGSQIKNLSSSEPDKMDETLVPADAYLGEWDIRDKELARLFNQCLDKGGLLTVILDSCHSGSGARGLAGVEKTRSVQPDPRTIDDPPDTVPAPEKRNALIFSAAQDFENAQEAETSVNGQTVVHGVFSQAFIQTLSDVSAGEPAGRIGELVWAKLNAMGRAQKPVIEGTAERKRSPLFSADGAAAEGGVIVPVITVRGTAILLQGGRANGLNLKCELQLMPGEKARAPVRIRIKSVIGLTQTEAEVISGDIKSVRTGDQFKMVLWTPADEVGLEVWLPPANLPAAEVDLIARRWGDPLAQSEKIKWIEDPTLETPTHVIAWGGKEWSLEDVGNGRSIPLGKNPAPETILGLFDGTSHPSPRLYLYLPPSAELAAQLRSKLKKETTPKAIEISPNKGFAPQYHLVGRTRTEPGSLSRVEYAWVLANQTQESAESLALPVRTDWLAAEKNLDEALKEKALQIARVRGWLALDSPIGGDRFPYALALVDFESGRVVREGTVVEGEELGLALVSEEDLRVGTVEARYVYVFGINKKGQGKLFFPGASVENRFPLASQESMENYPAEIRLGTKNLFKIKGPFGLETYILLTTAEPLPDPSILNFSGVAGEEPNDSARRLDDPLTALIKRVGTGTRSQANPAPMTWSIRRLMLQSVPREIDAGKEPVHER